MHRFWVFPLIIGFFGALFPFLALEGIAPLIPSLLSVGTSVLLSSPEVGASLLRASLWGFGVGALLGVGAATFDLARNGRPGQGARPLAANIAWCLLYAHGFIVVDMLLVFLWMWRNPLSPSDAVIVLTPWLPGLFSLVAIAWGTIRTISTDDVLNPRTLSTKLKRSAHIEG